MKASDQQVEAAYIQSTSLDDRILAETEARLSQARLRPARRPSTEEPDWPPNLADLHGSELSALMAYYTAMTSYGGYMLARSEVRKVAITYLKELAWSTAYLRDGENKVTDRRELANLDEEVQQLSIRALEVEADVRLLKTIVSGYEARYAAASREITRREGEK